MCTRILYLIYLCIFAGVCIEVVSKYRLRVFQFCVSILALNKTFYEFGDVAHLCIVSDGNGSLRPSLTLSCGLVLRQ